VLDIDRGKWCKRRNDNIGDRRRMMRERRRSKKKHGKYT
jgi:hypothetical protein